MRELLERKLKIAKAIYICFFVAAAASIVFLLLFLAVEKDVFEILTFLSFMAALVFGLTYEITYSPLVGNLKWLKKMNLEGVGDDISLERPTLPRSKIYCGSRALFCKKPYALLPYSLIAWVYLYERRVNGILVERALIVYTVDGKKHTLKPHKHEAGWLVENCICLNSPNVLLGYNAEQKAKYKQIKQAYKRG